MASNNNCINNVNGGDKISSTENGLTAEEIRELLQDNDYVRFTVADLNGSGRTKSVPKRHLHQYLTSGVEICADLLTFGPNNTFTPVQEVLECRLGNCVMTPMSGTVHSVPWAADGTFKVKQVLCEITWGAAYRDGAPMDACPRFIARKQLKRLDAMGYWLMSSQEAEFSAFKRGTMTPVFKGNEAFTTGGLAKFESYLYWMDSNFIQSDVDIGIIHLEDFACQFEVTINPQYGIKGADMMFKLKHGIKEMSFQKDIEVTFMSKPILGDNGNGSHFNHSLWTNGGKENAFHDESRPDRLSDVMKYWIAGLTRHASALTAICAPTVNCYRNLHTQFFPNRADWGIDDRSAAFRVKAASHKETYVENRLSSGSANPYLVLAATVAAGMDGIVNKLECPPPRQNSDPLLPETLEESLKALENDEVLVSALGEEFVRWFSAVKRENEMKLVPKLDFNEEVAFYFTMF